MSVIGEHQVNGGNGQNPSRPRGLKILWKLQLSDSLKITVEQYIEVNGFLWFNGSRKRLIKTVCQKLFRGGKSFYKKWEFHHDED